MGVLWDVEFCFRGFEASSVLMGSCCMERYLFEGGEGITNPLKNLESVKKMLTLMAELACVCGCFILKAKCSDNCELFVSYHFNSNFTAYKLSLDPLLIDSV